MPHGSSVSTRPASSRSGASLSTWSTGESAPSAVTKRCGSTATSPSWRYQYVHSPSGSPSSDHNPGIHGPTATTTSSTATGPALVETLVTAPDPSSANPVTSTPG